MKTYLLEMFEFYFAQSKQCLDYRVKNKSEKKGSTLERFYEVINETSKYSKHFFFLQQFKKNYSN